MIAGAVDTAYSIGWAIVAWIALTAAAATLALYTAAVTVVFAVRAVWRGVAAVVSLVQHSGARELPREAPEPAQGRTARPAPAWARTEEDAA